MDDQFEHVGGTFQEKLFELMDYRGLTNAEVYKRANLDRKHFSKMQWNNYLENQKVPVEIVDEKGNTIRIFASAHPGYFGVMNRDKEKRMQKVIEDWKCIQDWIVKQIL